jgi:hypothetical protein
VAGKVGPSVVLPSATIPDHRNHGWLVGQRDLLGLVNGLGLIKTGEKLDQDRRRRLYSCRALEQFGCSRQLTVIKIQGETEWSNVRKQV